jgi:hypothetical protein
MIFVSYRGDDDPWAAEMMFLSLCKRFGSANVFLDHHSIGIGGDFNDSLWYRLAHSEVMVVIVGERWLATDSGGLRRVDAEDDFVRREIEFALQARVKMLPVLVGTTGDLKPADLPPSIRPLASCQRLRLRQRSADSDLDQIMKRLATIVVARGSSRKAVPAPHEVMGRSAGPRYDLKRVKFRGQTALGDGNHLEGGRSDG